MEVKETGSTRVNTNGAENGWNEVLGASAGNPQQPRTTGYSFTSLEREWTVASCEARIKAQYEEGCQRWARESYKKVEQADMEEAAAMRSEYIADYGAGRYTWDGRYCLKSRTTMKGAHYLFFLLLRRCHPDVTEQTAKQVAEGNPEEFLMSIGWALGNVEAVAELKKQVAERKAQQTAEQVIQVSSVKDWLAS